MVNRVYFPAVVKVSGQTVYDRYKINTLMLIFLFISQIPAFSCSHPQIRRFNEVSIAVSKRHIGDDNNLINFPRRWTRASEETYHTT